MITKKNKKRYKWVYFREKNKNGWWNCGWKLEKIREDKGGLNEKNI